MNILSDIRTSVMKIPNTILFSYETVSSVVGNVIRLQFCEFTVYLSVDFYDRALSRKDYGDFFFWIVRTIPVENGHIFEMDQEDVNICFMNAIDENVLKTIYCMYVSMFKYKKKITHDLSVNEQRIVDIGKKLLANTCTHENIIQKMSENAQSTRELLSNILSARCNLTSNISDEQTLSVLDWWNKNICNCDDDCLELRSSDIWMRYKREYRPTMTPVEFRQILYSIVPIANIKKPRNKDSALEIKKIKWMNS